MLSEPPHKDLPFLLPHLTEVEGRKGGRREGHMQLWRDRAYWEGGPKQGTILETCCSVRLRGYEQREL